MNMTRTSEIRSFVLVVAICFFCACSGSDQQDLPSGGVVGGEDDALVLALAVLSENEDGSPKLLPARLGILTRQGDEWTHRVLEDPDSNVFHKAMVYRNRDGAEGILTLGGMNAVLKIWKTDGTSDTLWEADFGGAFSRMRDAEVGDIYGDGSSAIVVATHDQGVVAVLRPDGSGGFSIDELDRQPNTVVHEIELGDLDGDGLLEIYATVTALNAVDGTPQPGKVLRYTPAVGEGRVEVVDLGLRHAKEILVDDVDGDGRDELYVSVEAVSGGRVEIHRYDAGPQSVKPNVVATLDDQLCRFLTTGDVDGDGVLELVAATYKAGLWLLLPGEDAWTTELIDAESSGFEHAAILLDLDQDGRDELYVASDDQGQVRSYVWTDHGWHRNVILEYSDKLSRFTWSIMPVPSTLLPVSNPAFVMEK